MPHLDLAIYAVHVAFWGAFGITLAILRAFDSRRIEDVSSGIVAQQQNTGRFSRTVLAIHIVAFSIMYFGIAQAVLPNRVPKWFPGQRVVGTFVIAIGAGLMAWARVYFRSWRFRAKVERGHELATGGPFGLMRHPIYMGLNLLALGTAIWVPTPIVWLAFAIMCIGSDLRARVEEKLLEESFGEAYRSYRSSTRRFVPGIY